MALTRTNIEVDDDACGEVMRRFGLSTKKDAVNFALRWVATEPMTLEEALAMEGACAVTDLPVDDEIADLGRTAGSEE
jgi:Arc/MetJ family transcription regulator